MADSVTFRAPAKVNLALAVGRADSASGDARHPICSWMVRISLCDDLTLTRLPGGSLSRYAIMWAEDAVHRPEIDWPIRKDLAVRAHLLLQEATGRDLPVQMKIEKRIPLGAGLGGGSSDAASMLLACNALFELNLTLDHLHELAGRIGSDVPFFLRHPSAIVQGFGERISPAGQPDDLHLALCMPDLACATGEVYRLFDGYAPGDGPFEQAAQRVRAMAAAGRVRSDAPFNDLARAAFELQPDLARLAADLADLSERPVHVTGSGSSLFVVCESAFEAEMLAHTATQRLDAPVIAVGLEAAGEPGRL